MKNYFIDVKLCNKDIRFRMMGKISDNNQWMKDISRETSMYITFCGIVEEEIFNYISLEIEHKNNFECVFICGDKKFMITKFYFISISNMQNIRNMSAVDLNHNIYPQSQKQKGSRMVKGLMYCLSGRWS